MIIYYEDELNDDFSGDNIEGKPIDKNYKYINKSIFKKFTHFFWYRIIAFPIAFIYLKLKFRHKIINKKVLKGYKEFIIYGNHTHNLCDALIPTFVTYPRHVNVIVHKNNVSMPYLGKITPSLGAMPLPDDLEASKNFVEALEYYLNHKRCIMIYPEAHIWPFYTKIRPFLDKSFRYPIQFNKPTFCLTNTYVKRKNKVKIVTYVDGPFYADGKNQIEKRRDLRNKVYEKMCERSKNSNIEVIKYIKKEK